MLELEVIRTGLVTVDFGTASDSERIAKIAGDISCQYHEDRAFDPSRFEPDKNDPQPWHSRRGLVAWPEGEVTREIAVVKIPHPLFDFAALNAFVSGLKDFEHLLFPWLTVISSWANTLRAKGIWEVAVTDPDSLYCRISGFLNVPYYGYTSACCGLWFKNVDSVWGVNTAVLVGRKPQ